MDLDTLGDIQGKCEGSQLGPEVWSELADVKLVRDALVWLEKKCTSYVDEREIQDLPSPEIIK